MTHEKEHWKMIDGFLNYAVSSKGRIRNLNTGRILKHMSSKRGGWYAFIDLSKDGKRSSHTVHNLVAFAFLGPRPKGYIIHHKDLDRMNPALSNLEYLTEAEHRKIHVELRKSQNHNKHV